MPENKKTVLITGASSGFGAIFANRFAEKGYNLILAARRIDALEKLKQEITAKYEIKIDCYKIDLTDSEDLSKATTLLESRDDIEIFINNAGLGILGRYTEISAHKLENEVKLNVLALSTLLRSALSVFEKKGKGAIINLSSIASFSPLPYFADYAATKAFVRALSLALAHEGKEKGVYIQTLCPGPASTAFFPTAGAKKSSMFNKFMMKPEDVVDCSIKSWEKGKILCVPGFMNKIGSLLMRTAPLSVIGYFMKRFG